MNILEQREKKLHDSCITLTEKLQYLQKNPILKPTFISRINSNIFNSFSKTEYYTGCDEFNDFIKQNIKSSPVSINLYNDRLFVDYVDFNIDDRNKKINYNLDKYDSMDLI